MVYGQSMWVLALVVGVAWSPLPAVAQQGASLHDGDSLLRVGQRLQLARADPAPLTAALAEVATGSLVVTKSDEGSASIPAAQVQDCYSGFVPLLGNTLVRMSAVRGSPTSTMLTRPRTIRHCGPRPCIPNTAVNRANGVHQG